MELSMFQDHTVISLTLFQHNLPLNQDRLTFMYV